MHMKFTYCEPRGEVVWFTYCEPSKILDARYFEKAV